MKRTVQAVAAVAVLATVLLGVGVLQRAPSSEGRAPSVDGDVTGGLVPTKDVLIPPPAEPGSTSGCQPDDFVPASTTEDQVALIQRGDCNFSVKAADAEAAGYDAAIIFNEGQEGRTEVIAGALGAVVGIPVIGTTFAV